MTREHEFEPVHGLPEELPAGEEILWQGAPDWRAFAMHVFHVRAIALYGAILCAWRLVTVLYDGYGVAAALSSVFSTAISMATRATSPPTRWATRASGMPARWFTTTGVLSAGTTSTAPA